MIEQKPYLLLDNVCKNYGAKEAVKKLSLTVPRGSIYGIIGPNGAGKTTTIRMIMDIIAPDSGTITADGQRVTGDFKNRVGYLPEERGLYKKMTIVEIVTYLAELKGYSASQTASTIDGWLDKMSLLDYRQKKVEELSKGMQQKLQFITTLIHEPEMIILDELFSGLDPLNIELIKSILMDERKKGTTILFSTHVMEQAEKLCDYICLISGGEKVLDGRLFDIKSRFGTNSIQVDIEGDGAFAADIPGVVNITEFNNYIELKLARNTDSQAVLKAIADKVQIRRFELMEPSLYNIFIEVANANPREIKGEEVPR